MSLGSFTHSSQELPCLPSISKVSSMGNGLNITETAAQKEEIPRKVSLGRQAALNKPEIPVLLLGTLAAAVNGAILPIFGIQLSSVIKTFFEPPEEMRKGSNFWALIFVVLGIVSMLAYPIMSYLFTVPGCKLVQRIRSTCFDNVVRMEVGWFDETKHSSGAIGARLSTDATTVRVLVGDALAQTVLNLASAVARLVIDFATSWQLALIVLAMIPLIVLNGLGQMKFMKGYSADAKIMYEEASQVANDAVGSIRTVASFCAEDKLMEIYSKKCETPAKTGIRQGIISGVGFRFSFFVLFVAYGICFNAGARLVQAGKITFSEVFRVT